MRVCISCCTREQQAEAVALTTVMCSLLCVYRCTPMHTQVDTEGPPYPAPPYFLVLNFRFCVCTFMHACMYVCAYRYTRIYLYTHIYTYIHQSVCICICMSTCTCACVYRSPRAAVTGGWDVQVHGTELGVYTAYARNPCLKFLRFIF